MSRLGHRGIGHGFDFYSDLRAQVAGEALAAELEKSLVVLRDPEVNNYLAELARKLEKNSDAQPPVSIKVVVDADINAVTVPGGLIYLNSGTITAAQNEAQLVSVIAHEIAHVEARHATRNDSKEQFTNAIFRPMNLLPGPVSYLMQKIRQRVLLRIRRNAEREADLLGIEYEFGAGYDVRQFPVFLRIMQREDGDSTCAGMAFATCAERIANVESREKTFLPVDQSGAADTPEFQRVRARVLELTGIR